MNNINMIGYKLVKNNTTTAEKAPYTALPVPVGSLAFDNILETMLDAGTFMTKSTAQYLLKALYEYAADEIGSHVVRISTGTVSLYPAISGSFPSEDAEFDETRNALYVGASLSQTLRDSVAGVTPAYLGTPTGKGTVKLASVMDLASKTMGVIDGTNLFRLAGVNLTVPDGADESLALYTKDVMTKVCDISVSENDGGLYLKCSLPNSTAIAKGSYKIRLASHGIDPTDPLSIVTCPVTLVNAVVPPTPIVESADKLIKVMSLGDLILNAPCGPLTGVNVGYDEANTNGITCAGIVVAGEPYMWTSSRGSGLAATSVDLMPNEGASYPPAGTYTGELSIRRDLPGGGEEEMLVPNVTVRVV